MDFEWHTCAHVLLLLLGFLASVLLPFCPSLSMYAIWHYMHKFALHFLIAVRNLLAWISHIGVRPSLTTSNSRVGSISENIFYHFDNLILNFYGRILVIRQSNIFWYWHHPNEWDLAPPLMTCTTRTRKFPPSLKWMAAELVLLLRLCAVVSKAYIEAEFSITVSDGEYKSLTQELNRKEVLIESI